MSGFVVAVDVGGTSIKAALVDAGGGMHGEHVEPTPVDAGPTAVVERICAVATTLAQEPDVRGIGVVVPGAVDAERGVATFSANLGWRDVPLRDLLQRDTALPVAFDHDVRAAGLAEQSLGSTAAEPNSLLVVIGTGVAAVLRVDGRMVSGATGLAGELGHISVDPTGEPCPCGQRGCLERYASAAAISRRYAEHGGAAGTPAAEVSRRVPTDPAAAHAWDDAVQAIAAGLAAATMLLDPGVITIAGGLSDAGEALLAPLRTALAQRVTWRPPPPVERSSLGARAGLLGAAVLAWRLVGRPAEAPSAAD